VPASSPPPRLAIVIPALDEEASLPSVLAKLVGRARVVVVDNGSTDRTAAVARASGAEVVQEPRRGYGTAVLAGFRHIADSPPDYVIVLDADNADAAATLPHLVAPLVAGEADVVLSNRTRTAEHEALTVVQRLGNGLAVHLIALSTGFGYLDMGPFRALSWRSVERLGMTDPTWGWNVEMQMKAALMGFRVHEVALPYRARQHGDSKISGSVTGAIRAGYRILLAVNRYRRMP
jgi:glycosyltransferase involved in cell wall biosynthesis